MRKTYLRNSRSQTTLTSIHKPPTCLATPFNVQGFKWEIHKHAPDINQPSCPHMHAIGKPWKLDLYTGIIIDCNTGIIIGMIKPRELLAIWRAKGVLKIIIAERALYEELHQKDPIRYPELPPLLINPSEKQKTKTKKLRYRRNTTTIQKSDSIIVELTSRQPLEKIRGHCYYSKSRNRSKKNYRRIFIEQEEILKEYIIPHNYKNNGRIFNMFEKRAVTKALLWMVPITGAIFYLLPISVQMKFFFEVLIGMPPALIFLLELDEMIKAVLLFSKNRRIYYNFGGKGVKESEITRFKTAYEKAGKRKNRK